MAFTMNGRKPRDPWNLGDSVMNPPGPTSPSRPVLPGRPSNTSKPGGLLSGIDWSSGMPKPPAPPEVPKKDQPLTWDWFENQSNLQEAEAMQMLEEGMNRVTGGLDEFTEQYVQMLSDMEARQNAELATQIGEGRASIDEATARAMETITGQANPYANLRMAETPVVTNPLASYMQNSGASADAVSGLAQMLNQGNASSANAFQNLAALLGASAQQSTTSRATDVDLARAASTRDLEANRRALAFQIGRDRMMGELQQRSASNEAKRAAELQALQQRLGINQQFNADRNQLLMTILQLAGQDQTRRNPILGLLKIRNGNNPFFQF